MSDASNGAASPHRRVWVPAHPVGGAAHLPRRHRIQAHVHGGLQLGAIGKLPLARSPLCQHRSVHDVTPFSTYPASHVGDAGRAAHEGVGAVADGAVDGRKDASHALSLRVHPRPGRVWSPPPVNLAFHAAAEKNIIRIRDFGCVPAHRHGVECVGVYEHLLHGRDRADVPSR